MERVWRRRLDVRPAAVGFAAAVAYCAVFLGLFGGLAIPAPNKPIRFPSTISMYSIWNAPLAVGPIRAASILYLGRFDEDFFTTRKSLAISANGSSYRRLQTFDVGEQHRVLSADGTFVVTPIRGGVQTLSLATGQTRPFRVGPREVQVLAIGADGRDVLLAESDDRGGFTLTRLELPSGQVQRYPISVLSAGSDGFSFMGDPGGAAISPDGTRIAISTPAGLWVIRADSGAVLHKFSSLKKANVNGDAWSVDGTRLAVTSMTFKTIRYDDDSWVDDARRPAVMLVDFAAGDPAIRPIRRGLEVASDQSVIGWRDPQTLLTACTDCEAKQVPGGLSHAKLSWLDIATGKQSEFAATEPNTTSLETTDIDVARNLVPQWQVSELPVDRGPASLVAGSCFMGVLVALLAAAYRRRLAPVDLPFGVTALRTIIRG